MNYWQKSPVIDTSVILSGVVACCNLKIILYISSFSVLQKLEQDKEKLYSEISYYKETLRNTNKHVEELNEELKKLNNIIQKMELELQKKDKHVLQVKKQTRVEYYMDAIAN